MGVGQQKNNTTMTDAAKRAAVFKEKNMLVRKLFHLPERERIVQDYHCGYVKGKILPIQGRLWITFNYVLFESHLKTQHIQIPFAKITDIKFQKFLGIPACLVIH